MKEPTCFDVTGSSRLRRIKVTFEGEEPRIVTIKPCGGSCDCDGIFRCKHRVAAVEFAKRNA